MFPAIIGEPAMIPHRQLLEFRFWDSSTVGQRVQVLVPHPWIRSTRRELEASGIRWPSCLQLMRMMPLEDYLWSDIAVNGRGLPCWAWFSPAYDVLLRVVRRWRGCTTWRNRSESQRRHRSGEVKLYRWIWRRWAWIWDWERSERIIIIKFVQRSVDGEFCSFEVEWLTFPWGRAKVRMEIAAPLR